MNTIKVGPNEITKNVKCIELPELIDYAVIGDTVYFNKIHHNGGRIPGIVVLSCCCDLPEDDIVNLKNGDIYLCPEHGEERILYTRLAK